MGRWLRLGLAVAVALALIWWARTPEVLIDHTRIDSGVTRQVRPVLQLAYTDADGRTARVLVDAERYSVFVQDAVRQLESARLRLRDSIATRLEPRLAPSFAAMAAAVPDFLDWYLAPGTGITLAGVALAGLPDPAAAVREAVAARYRDRVLQPSQHEPALRAAFVAVLDAVAAARDVELDAVDRAFRRFVLAESRRGVDGPPVVELDWRAQSRRLTLPLPAAPGSSGLGAELPARLAGPALGLVAALGIGAEAGASLGWFAWPLGAALGAGIGLAADRAIAWARRPAIAAAARSSLAATRADWSSRMAGGLAAAVDAWFDDAMQSLPRFDQNGRRALSAAVSVPSSR